MAGWSGLGKGLKSLVLGGAALCAVAVAGMVWQGRPLPEPHVETTVPDPVAAVPDPAEAEPAAAAGTAAPSSATTPLGPSFDVVRVEPDGAALVAGRAEAGQDVAVLIDGAEAALTRADPQGRFVVFLTLAASTDARVMTLELRPAGGAAIRSGDQVVLAATPGLAPAPPLAAAPAPAPAPDEVAAAALPPLATDPPEPAPAEAAVVARAVEPVTSAPSAQSAPSAIVKETETPVVASASPQTAVTSAASVPAPRPLPPPPAIAAAPATPMAILLSGDTVRVLQSPQAAAPPPGAVSIDVISYTTGGAVALSGGGEARATLRLYLDNRLVLETAIGEDGTWAGTLPPVAPGVYTLRADQVSPNGQVTSRFETPFQREAVQALAAQSAPSAATGAGARPGKVSVTVQPGFTLWQIARETYGDGMLYVRVYDANKMQIDDPDLIYPGQVLTVPQTE